MKRLTNESPFRFVFQLVFDRDQHEERTVLGHGTYGKVYAAYDRFTWKKFALKEIPLHNSVFNDFLENEIKLLSTLSHRNSSFNRRKIHMVFFLLSSLF